MTLLLILLFMLVLLFALTYFLIVFVMTLWMPRFASVLLQYYKQRIIQSTSTCPRTSQMLIGYSLPKWCSMIVLVVLLCGSLKMSQWLIHVVIVIATLLIEIIATIRCLLQVSIRHTRRSIHELLLRLSHELNAVLTWRSCSA